MDPHAVTEDVTFDGGTPAEQRAVLAAFRTFWTANNTFDIPLLETIWGSDPDDVYFNSNGHNYHGVEEWKEVWRYYGPRFVTTVEAQLSRVRVLIRDGLAVVSDEGVRREWEAHDVDTNSTTVAATPRVRGTVVLTKTGAGAGSSGAGSEWRVVHAHFSPRRSGPRVATDRQ